MSDKNNVTAAVYATLGTNDHDRAARFYDAVMATIDWRTHFVFSGGRAYSERGAGEGFSLWVLSPFNGEAATAGNGTMVGLPAVSRAAVHAFHEAAMANGGSDEGGPGPRPHYGPDWYAAYVRDPEGNKLAIVYRGLE